MSGSAERLPFPDASFDATLAQLVLHFVTDPDAARARLRGALFEQVGSPASVFTLEASVRAVRGVRADQLK